MANLSEIRDTVLTVLNDDSIDESRIDRLINAGYKFCARRVLLPGLESSGEVEVVPTASEVAIPAEWNYSRNLYGVSISDSPSITILNSIPLLRAKYPFFDTKITKGDVEFIVLRGSSIIYHPVPETHKTMRCLFYRSPEELKLETDIPSAIPEDDQNDLLSGYALWKLWAQIEDGIEGQKVNTAYYKGEFFTIYNSLDTTIEVGQSTVDPVRDSSWI